MEKALAYAKENQSAYLEELKDYLRIPSISASEEHKDKMIECANFVAGKLKTAGLKKVNLIKTKGNPLVYGEWMGAKGKPTILIYGHYDVQPPDPYELWDNDPFDPVIKDGNIYARGSDDNKGQNLVHIKGVEAYLKNEGKLPVNVKFLIEGEEEVGSESITTYLKTNKKLLACDAVLISDTSMYAPGVPTINYGLRGLAYLEVTLTGPNRDLHSGSFGGALANPINELAKIIAKLHDKNNKITIPNFYKDVKKLTKKEKENIASLKFSDRKFAKEYGVREVQGEKGYSTLERLWARPTLDCNGIYGGYTGEGAKTVLPSKATAKISMRLVPNQDPDKVAKEFTKYVKSLTPKSCKVEVVDMHGGRPVVIPLDDPYLQAAARATSKAFGKKTVYTREGGSIPIVIDFMENLKAPVILMGFGLDTDDIHSPNEHYPLENFEKGIYSSIYFFDEIKELKK